MRRNVPQSREELRELLVAGVAHGKWVAVRDGYELRFVSASQLTPGTLLSKNARLLTRNQARAGR